MCMLYACNLVAEQYLYNNQGSNLVIILDGYDETSDMHDNVL